MRVSVIVPTYEQWPRLRLVLLGFTRVRARQPWELIVVDDGCATPIAEQVAREPRLAELPLRVERLDINRGRSAARNRGVAVARGDLCLFLDGDAIPHRDWIEGHAKLYAGGRRIFTLGHIRSIPSTELLADPTAGAPFPHVPAAQREAIVRDRDALVVTDAQVLAGALHRRSRWGSLPMPPEVAARGLAWLVDPAAAPLLWSRFVPHNAGVLRRDFEAVGGFDRAFPFYEGVDLAYRLHRAGVAARVAHDATSYQLYHFHDFSAASGEHARRARGAARLVAKHAAPEMAVAASGLLGAAPRPDELTLAHPADATAARRAHVDHARLVRFYVPRPDGGPASPPRHDATSTSWVPRATWLETVRGYTSDDPEALTDALPATMRDGDRVDLRRAETWGLANVPAFYAHWLQMDARRMAFIRDARTRPRRARYRFDYVAAIDGRGVPAGTALSLDLPFPCDTRDQRVRLVDAAPALAEHVLAQAGCIYALPVRAAPRIVVRYAVELDVAEIRRPLARTRPLSRASRPAMKRFLALPPHDRDLVARVLASLGGSRTPHRLARAIRDWVLAHVHFTLVERCTCFTCCLRDLDTVRAGGCAFLASVFVALARAAGIPARLVRGSLLGFPGGDGFVTRTRNVGFGHTWAEAYAEPTGWFPVEFHSCVLQPPILTERNTPDPERRAGLLAEGAAAADYLFGSLDNQRVRCGTFDFAVAGLPVETTVTVTPISARSGAARRPAERSRRAGPPTRRPDPARTRGDRRRRRRPRTGRPRSTRAPRPARSALEPTYRRRRSRRARPPRVARRPRQPRRCA